MASESLKEYVAQIDEYVEKQPDMQYVDAYYQACKVAFWKEKDKKFGCEVAKKGRDCINAILKAKRGQDIWQFENVCQQYNAEPRELTRYYDFLKEESFYKFESFIYYMERYRPQEKRFYLPRQKTLHTVMNDLEDLANREIKFLGISLPSRTGKLISDDTPVLTEDGWKNHGDLKVGDYVYDFEGQLVKVVYVHPKDYATKRVWFSDHTYIDCHPNHEWVLYDRHIQDERTVETKFVENHLKSMEKGKYRNRWYLPEKKVLNGRMKHDLKVPPYVLGAWLGDGTNRKPVITICDTDTEILNSIESLGYKHTTSHKQVGCRAYSFEGLRKDLQEYGMCMKDYATQKHIPDEYMTAHPLQRLELLAGLLDTDGTLVKKEHRYHYSTIDERLKDDVVSLVSSFGWRVCVTEQEPKTSTSGIVGKHKVYVVSFNPTFHIPCRVERKKLFEYSKQKRIGVDKIEDIEPKSGNCITVEGGIYRVGKRMIPTHNSTICIFYLAWKTLLCPDSHSAMGGHSGILAKGFHLEYYGLLSSEDYTFQEIFEYFYPNRKFVLNKSAEELSVTLGKVQRFPTLACRGMDGSWTGIIDVSWDGLLYVDDLIKDREHSLSPTRMEKTFQEYLNKMVDRKSGATPPKELYPDSKFDGATELMVGTLWNVLDPLERMRKLYENDPLYRFRKIPALNENDESNFDYEIGGFTTEYFRDIREKLDDAEWQSKYQQNPYVREGLLYPLDELRYFNGIMPEGDSRVVAVVDVAWGGGDYLSMPIGREFENGDVYIFDWIYSKEPKESTIPLVVGSIVQNEIRQCRFEGNVGGAMYSDYVNDELSRQGWKCSCSERKAPNNMAKVEKIIAYAGDIKRKYIFLESKKPTTEELERDKANGIKRYYRSSMYQNAMDDLGSFVSVGKNVHDDSPDSLTQLEMFIEDGLTKKVQILRGIM